MAAKFITLCAVLAVANAGFLPGAPTYSYAAPAAITSQSDNILRSPGNLAQISTFSKTIDTPYSSSSKSDVRVSNPGVYATAYAAPLSYAAPAPLSYAAPAPLSYAAHAPLSYAAPAPLSYAAHAPLSYAAPAPIYKSAYAAPALQYAAPAPIYKGAYAAPLSYAAPALQYAAPAPVLKSAYAYGAAPAVAAPGPVVAHATFSGLGTSYAW